MRKLSPIPGVLPRPIVSDPRKEYLSIFSRAIFSTPWYFRERPNFDFGGDLRGFMALSDLMSALARRADLGALRPNDVPQLQFAASAVFTLEPCFGCMTAFLLGQPQHWRPLTAFGAKCQRLIGCRDAACFRRWWYGCRTCVLRHGLMVFGLNHSGVLHDMPSFRIRLDDIPVRLIWFAFNNPHLFGWV